TIAIAIKVTNVVVPLASSTRLVPMSVDEAITRLRAAKFRVIVEDGAQGDRTTPEGTVLSQGPTAGELKPQGSVITLHVVGDYAEGVQVPDLRGRTTAGARKALAKLGLGTRARQETAAPRDDDIVYDTDPGPGAIMPPGSVVLLLTDP